MDANTSVGLFTFPYYFFFVKLCMQRLHSVYRSLDDFCKNHSIQFVREDCTALRKQDFALDVRESDQRMFSLLFCMLDCSSTYVNMDLAFATYFKGKWKIHVAGLIKVSSPSRVWTDEFYYYCSLKNYIIRVKQIDTFHFQKYKYCS